MIYIHRHAEKSVLEYSAKTPVLLVCGPRGSGKTTMLKHLIEQEGAGRRYIDLNVPINFDHVSYPMEGFRLKEGPVFLDNVELAPNVLQEILRFRNLPPGSVWAASSFAFFHDQEYNRGFGRRGTCITLPPLSRREKAGLPPLKYPLQYETLLEESKSIPPVPLEELKSRICSSGMPGCTAVTESDLRFWYSEWLSDMSDREIQLYRGPLDGELLDMFIHDLAYYAGQQADKSEMKDYAKIYRYYSLSGWFNELVNLGLIWRIPPLKRNGWSSNAYAPLCCYCDSGLLLSVAGFDPSIFSGQFRSYAVSEILKSFYGQGGKPKSGFTFCSMPYSSRWNRDDSYKDAVLTAVEKNTFYPMITRFTPEPDPAETELFDELLPPGLKRGHGVIISAGQELVRLDSGDLIVPASLL